MGPDDAVRTVMPTSRAAAPGAQTELTLGIGGVLTAIAMRDAALADIVRQRYKGFLSSEEPRWRIALDLDTVVPPAVPGDVVVRCDGHPARLAVERGDFSAILDLDRRCGRVALNAPNEFSIDSFLRIAYTLALLDVPGLVVHAASLIRGGKAYLFCGRSGAGKTTLTRLSPDATLLSDELSIGTMSNGRVRCHGTPFWGELARAGEDRCAPLHAIFFLHHGRRHKADALKSGDALRRLLSTVLFFAREPELTARVLGIASTLIESVPSFDLHFRPDAGFWEVVDDV
jgi:hypothetical protein